METNQHVMNPEATPELTRHKRAMAILKRLVADKQQAEKDMVENFHKDPAIQAAVAELKRRREERGTAAI